jgi:very-short-patch-repair endonuclease
LLGEMAGGQHGVVARWQLDCHGIGRGAIERRLSRGTLHRLHQGVYAVGHRALTAESRWMAAVVACGPKAVLSHRSAAQIRGLLPRSSIASEVTRPRAFRARRGIKIYRSIVLVDEQTLVEGIPVTSVSRTLFDLAALSSRRQMERMLNEAKVLELTDRLSLPDLFERYPRRRGSALLRELLADEATLRGVTRSELEERFVSFVDASGLPQPRLNADLSVYGRFFRVDCLWAEQRLIVELDGRASHGTGRAFERDRERDRLLLTDGWRVVRVTWRQLHDDPAALAADLRRLLTADAAPDLLPLAHG